MKFILKFIPELNDKQLDRISEYLSNLSLLVVASLVVPNIFGGNKPDMSALTSGIILTTMFLIVSMILIRKSNE